MCTDRPYLLRLVHANVFFIKFKFKSSGSVWFNMMVGGILWDYWKIFTHYFHCVLWELIFIVTRQGVWQIHFMFFSERRKTTTKFWEKRVLFVFCIIFVTLYSLTYYKTCEIFAYKYQWICHSLITHYLNLFFKNLKCC